MERTFFESLSANQSVVGDSAVSFGTMRSIILVLALLLSAVHGYKVLFLVPFTGPSHWLMLKHFIRELTERGNEVTCITSFKFGDPIHNYTEVLIDPAYPIREKCESIS